MKIFQFFCAVETMSGQEGELLDPDLLRVGVEKMCKKLAYLLL